MASFMCPLKFISIPLHFFRMAFLEFLAILIIFSVLVFHYTPQNVKIRINGNWLLLGMISEVLANLHQLHNFIAMKVNLNGGTFMLRGPWFANVDMLITTDPLDIHHVMSKNFLNYPKGQKFRKIFDIFGDGIFNVDGQLWQIERKTIASLFRQPKTQTVFEAIVCSKVERELLPILDSISKTGMEIDLQEIFQRLTLDTISKFLLDYDPESLSIDFPCFPLSNSISDMEEGTLYRHLMPPIFWKLQQILRMGNEQKLRDASNVIDDFVYQCIARIQNESGNLVSEHGKENLILVTSLIKEFRNQGGNPGDPNKFLRDSLVTLIGAGRDTTSTTLSWFFYLLAKNPIVEHKIREEIHTILGEKVDGLKWNYSELGKMVYLHGALRETLRLYPPIPFNHKTPLQPDVLPSGHRVSQKTKIILYYYGMGRMKKIWGEDCMEFKPERWISNKGEIKHEPSYKFPAFSGGPRICLGMDMSFTQLKIVTSAIIYHYHIELIEDHLVIPKASIVLQMKHGLKVRLTKISDVNI